MSSILDTIPAERLDLLDKAILFHGSHKGGSGGPDCQHCARELLHEVVTGKHADRTPPGVTAFVSILPAFNDCVYWRDNAHRTEVMRPYLRKLLTLDPTRDIERAYALIDHFYRVVLANIFDKRDMGDKATALRALAPIVDLPTAKAAADLTLVLALAHDLTLVLAYTLVLAHDLAHTLTLVLAHTHDLAHDLAHILTLALAHDLAHILAHILTLAHDPENRQKAWEQSVRETFDLICAIP